MSINSPTAPDAGSAADLPDGAGPAVDHGAAGVTGLVPDPGPVGLAGAVGDQAAALGPTGRALPVLPEPTAVLEHGPARVIALCNQKGGVGKTTTTINLGAALAEYGRRVLLVDFDPQSSLTVGMGIDPLHLEGRSVYNLLLESGVGIDDILIKSNIPGLDVLPSSIDLSVAEMNLVHEVARESFLKRALDPVRQDYDYVLIDCQPSLGLLTINALNAAQGVLIPLECEYFSLRGVALILDAITKVKARLNPELEIEGVLATMFDGRTVHARDVLQLVVERFGDRVFHSVIARTVRFPETTVAGEPITTFAPSSSGATAYRDLAREVLARHAGAR